ncbi:hypothetical protein RI367_000317 [Sorochytrium milnesiophthora]
MSNIRDARSLLSRLRKLLRDRPSSSAETYQSPLLRALMRQVASFIVREYGKSVCIDSMDVNSLLHAYLLLGDGERFLSLHSAFNDLTDDNAYACNMLISVLLSQGSIVEALAVVQRQMQAGRLVDAVAITAIVEAMVDRGMHSDALRFFELMCTDTPLPPSPTSSSSLGSSRTPQTTDDLRISAHVDTRLAARVLPLYMERMRHTTHAGQQRQLRDMSAVQHIFEHVVHRQFPSTSNQGAIDIKYLTALRLIEQYLAAVSAHHHFVLPDQPFVCAAQSCAAVDTNAQPCIQRQSESLELLQAFTLLLRALSTVRRLEVFPERHPRHAKYTHSMHLAKARQAERRLAMFGMYALFALRHYEYHACQHYPAHTLARRKRTDTNPPAGDSVSSLPWWPSQSTKSRALRAAAAFCARNSMQDEYTQWHHHYTTQFHKPSSV